ncbi:hypothetical protein FRX31_005983 [Thalictrum thalictroides]|uniref:DUF4283 domain-containing protein n=1 Tax=Thalictrum thalictroides TaxID=46969 RepID=A0A7J6X6E0_THATH|nr:hypothetical protein FRX31_005983 [Thalictrum thalictroides]
MQKGVDLWREYLVGFFVDKRMPYHLVKRSIERDWKFKAAVQITTDGKLNYFKFADPKEIMSVLEGGPIFVAGRIMSKQGLSLIGSRIGRPKCCDEFTKGRERLDFAKLCVEVKADTTFPTTLKFKLGEGIEATVGVEYTWKPQVCSHCKIFGHTTKNCVQQVLENWVKKVVENLKEVSDQGSEDEKQNSSPSVQDQSSEPTKSDDITNVNRFHSLELEKINAETYFVEEEPN